LMEVPVRSMTGITFSVLSQAWKDKNTGKVFTIYSKTALNLLIAGVAIMGTLVLNMQNVIALLGSTYQPMIVVVYILGVSKLIDLGTGLNSHLLLSSKHWKIEFVTNIFLVFMAGGLNYLLVRRYNIIGSAWATLIAFTVYNTVRFFLIWKLFKMQPFKLANLWVILIAAGSFVVAWIIPHIKVIFLDIVVRSALYVCIFFFLLIRLHISHDMNSIYEKFKSRMNF
jgi:O-antigen/teichoic acid export membrane protein